MNGKGITMEVNIDMDRISSLARLHLSEKEKNELSRSLSSILAHINKLSNVDLENIEPSAHAVPLRNVLRSDEIGEAFDVKTALMNAPRQRDNLIIVPKVVE
ncbi:MAG: Asp-tRNA(Asn)/Glu-tRNA(Gln) amidotransferase subunit GatC [Puniceicoccales bacterium]|jgi:aspartyl-tRNA(Asn)/glutamyl-tRNA(Gln) amidotransferase subunit C|nr:Asp-tRNA(Asn)/Glu-tRNA(Gln) amidotransferase subunit GatC [Puniceicoccales bacterium]